MTKHGTGVAHMISGHNVQYPCIFVKKNMIEVEIYLMDLVRVFAIDDASLR